MGQEGKVRVFGDPVGDLERGKQCADTISDPTAVCNAIPALIVLPSLQCARHIDLPPRDVIHRPTIMAERMFACKEHHGGSTRWHRLQPARATADDELALILRETVG